MINIKVRNSSAKGYLIDLSRLHFNSTAAFIMELFLANPTDNSAAEDEIFTLIETLGYRSVQEIPASILDDMQTIYHVLADEMGVCSDKEKQAYLLLHLLHKNELILAVDQQVIDDLDNPLSLQEDSIVTFYNPSNSTNLTFKTL